MAKERIGIMGGSFDPIHQGHIRMAQHALESQQLDRVLMLPSGNPPHKPDITPAEHRWRMVCAACAGIPGLIPCREELDRTGVIYTVNTLSRLQEKYPKAELFYLIGADMLMRLHRWYRLEEVLQMCTFIVFPRTSAYTPQQLNDERKKLTALGARILLMDMEVLDASSTDARQAIQEGGSTPQLPIAVRQYAQAAGLYGAELRIPQGPQWLEMLFQDLTVKRFAHTLAVADTARRLALLHGLDPLKAEIAGLLHDCAKCLPLEEMQRIARENHLTEDESILASGALLHSAVGAYLARTKYGCEDEEVIQAILSHTTGKAGMTQLDMAVWLADTIEPTRAPYPLLDKTRMLAGLSLEKAMITSLEGTLQHVRKKGDAVHPATLETLDYLKNLPQ
ncbi:MAG: nicotinate-nucleotide adenylyltransferase [Clostridia bacterium]|nr:nicotinate-nucleotide adenylyltransferase [Clostridia bacterium]